MKEPKIDETKLPEVMELIEEAASLIGQGGSEDELNVLQKKLRELTGDKKLDVKSFWEYWGYTDLETVARKALMAPPKKTDVTDEQIKNIVVNILNHDEAEMDYWIDFLEVNTGLDASDYIFYPNLVGLGTNASLDEIADKIIEDMKNGGNVILL